MFWELGLVLISQSDGHLNVTALGRQPVPDDEEDAGRHDSHSLPLAPGPRRPAMCPPPLKRYNRAPGAAERVLFLFFSPLSAAPWAVGGSSLFTLCPTTTQCRVFKKN